MSTRRTSWVQLETDDGDKYYYDDPELGGSGTTQWEAPPFVSSNETGEQENKHKIFSACSSKHLKKFMKNKNKHHAQSRNNMKIKVDKLRSARIARLREARGGGVSASDSDKEQYKKFLTDDGTPYYVSASTNETTWTVPSNAEIVDGEAEIVETNSQPEYETFTTDDGRPYYRNSITGVTSWELPSAD
eukprot:g5636.t1